MDTFIAFLILYPKKIDLAIKSLYIQKVDIYYIFIQKIIYRTGSFLLVSSVLYILTEDFLMKFIGYIVSVGIMVFSSYFSCISSQLPGFLQKYCEKIPHLQQYEGCVLSNEEKAHTIVDYLCLFFQKKQSLVIEGCEVLANRIKCLMQEEKPLLITIKGFPFKSTNHEKQCLSSHADIGDYIALMTLDIIVQNIGLLYPQVHCKIFSDGLAFRVCEHDAPDEEILEYHDELNGLAHTFFPHVSFVSWKVSENINSYEHLQSMVSTVLLPDDSLNEKSLKEMSIFILEEFNCVYWRNIFLQQAHKKYCEEHAIQEKQKIKEQNMNAIRNALTKEKAQSIAIELSQKVKQFSLFFKSLPEYRDCINLCIHSSNKDKIDIAASSLPINLMYGHCGSPWYNAVVVDEERQELKGFFKTVFNKKVSLNDHAKRSFQVQTDDAKYLSLEYITTSH
jgi:pyoverdine/dityrosine biosynthesis protein Dit1